MLRVLVPILIPLLAACGSTQASPRSDVGVEVADETDTCPPISGACYDGFDFADDDGCPDPPPMRIAFDPGTTVMAERSLRDIADITTRRPAVASVVRFEVVGYSAPNEDEAAARNRAEVVAAELEALGFGRDRLDVSVGGPEDIEGSDPDATDVTITPRHCLDEHPAGRE